ncbi:MAG TPA: cupredoxin domain-containing protein [Anaerolineales bacterium]|nr:cupredoxin domain-containing protein [Anaerolineales bacterium]
MDQSTATRIKLPRWLAFAVLAGLAALILWLPLPARAAPPTERIFRIEASRWAYSPAVLAVNPGDRVTIELAATDVVHGLGIDGYHVATTSDPGQTSRMTFVADQAGTYRFRCTVTCGNLHPFMIGKLQVGENSLLWRGRLLAVLALLAAFWTVRR